jgi:hypothetical protein
MVELGLGRDPEHEAHVAVELHRAVHVMYDHRNLLDL